MNIRSKILSPVFGGLLLGGGVSAFASDVAMKSTAQVSASTQVTDDSYAVADRAMMAAKLIALGRQMRDPDMLMLAASILRDNDIILAQGDESDLIFGQARKGAVIAATTSGDLYREALALAPGDARLAEQVAEEIASEDKGIVPQAIAYTHDLKAGRVLTMRARAEAGRIALVRVRSDGDSALELRVLDEEGRIACQAGGATASDAARDLLCRWTPARTGLYRIELSNRGNLWSRTILVSN